MLPEPASVSSLRSGWTAEVVVRTRNPVLFDNEPARVGAEVSEERVEIDVAGPELTEDPTAPALRTSAPSRIDASRRVETDVLEVDVADAFTPVAERLDRVGAADEQVTRVEQQVDARQLEQSLDLLRRLDVRARVRVEDRLEAAHAPATARARPSASRLQPSSSRPREWSERLDPGWRAAPATRRRRKTGRASRPRRPRTGRASVAAPSDRRRGTPGR